MIHRMMLLVLVMAWASGPGLAQRERRPPSPHQLRLEAHAKIHGFSGAVLAADGEEVVFSAAVDGSGGGGARRLGAETRFAIGGMSRTFALALGFALEEAGLLDMRASPGRYLPEVESPAGQVLTSSPRDLLIDVIEACTGRRYEVVLREKLLEPLGLHDTGIHHLGRPDLAVAPRAELIAGLSLPIVGWRAHEAAGREMYSTVADLHRFIRVVDAPAVRKAFQARAALLGPEPRDPDERGRSMVSRSEGPVAVAFGRADSSFAIVLSDGPYDHLGALARDLARITRGETLPPLRRGLVSEFWERVHAGDLLGAGILARRIESEVKDLGGLGGPEPLQRTALRLIERGYLKEGAAVLRALLELEPEDEKAAALLATIAGPATAPPQFVDQWRALPGPECWSEAVHPLDLDDDGRLDLVFANCNGWHRPGDMAAPSADPLLPTLLLNKGVVDGRLVFEDVSARYLPADFLVHAKNVAVCDIDGDGHEDLVFALAFGARQRILRFDPEEGRFLDETAARLPDLVLNSNNVGYGDLDGDGDLDLVWVDGGPNSDRAPGGKARLLLNDGTGRFVEAAERLGAKEKIGAQNAKIIDIDGDLDLDVVVDGKSPVTQLYRNDGEGNFTLDETVIPAGGRGSAPYEIEWADLDHDGDLDAVHMSRGGDRRDGYLTHLLRNMTAEKGELAFEVVLDAFEGRNREDENEFAFMDANDDGFLDLVVATLVSAPTEEKLFLNAGEGIAPGFLRERRGAFSRFPDGTLDLCIADFDGDGRLDVVTAQGESKRYGDFGNRLYRNFGPPDTRPPRIVTHTSRAVDGGYLMLVKVEDSVADDGHDVVDLRIERRSAPALPMAHVGGGIYRVVVPSAPETGLRVVAVDRQGNVLEGPWTR